METNHHEEGFPYIVEVYNILNLDDSQRGFSNVVDPHIAFQGFKVIPSSGHDPTVCYVHTRPNKGKPIFSFCNRVSHITERC